MEQLFNSEKRNLVERYMRMKDFYWTLKHDTSLRDNPEYDPDAFWLNSFNTELELLKKKHGISDKDNPTKYSWVGISPDPTVYSTMSALYERLLELPLNNYIASVEAYTKEGYRPHIHMILFTHHKPYRVIDKLAKHFKCEKNFVNCKNMTQFYDEKLSYIRGDKDEIGKQQYVIQDREEREREGIPHVIEK